MDPGGLDARPYDTADRPACLDIFDSNVPTSFDLGERAEFTRFLDDLPGPYFVVLDQRGSIVACGGWARSPGTSRADLCWGLVRRSRQRRGWGRALTRVRLDSIDSVPDIDRVRLQTSQDAEGFYRRLGFVVVEREVDGFRPGFDRIVMERDTRG